MIHAKVANYISKRRREKAKKQEHKFKYNHVMQIIKTAIERGENHATIPLWVEDENFIKEVLAHLQKRGYKINERGIPYNDYIISWGTTPYD
jgi:L-serine deaminase